MSNVSGRLKFAYGTLANMEAEIIRLKDTLSNALAREKEANRDWSKEAIKWAKERESFNKKIAHFEALIADAPHQSKNCKVRWNAHSGDWEYDICSCWKSRALDTGAKG